MAWPDVVVGLMLVWGAFRGWRVGLIRELTGTVALVAAIGAAFTYDGRLDDVVRTIVHLGAGSAHVVGLLFYAALAYALVSIVGFALGRVAKLPLVSTANAALGAALGFAKSLFVVWAILYVALFFPLSADLRADLHRSMLARTIAGHNDSLDDAVRADLPWFIQPFAGDAFDRHHV